jgi:hypothetical protein
MYICFLMGGKARDSEVFSSKHSLNLTYCNFFVNSVLMCYSHSQESELQHILKECINCVHSYYNFGLHFGEKI